MMSPADLRNPLKIVGNVPDLIIQILEELRRVARRSKDQHTGASWRCAFEPVNRVRWQASKVPGPDLERFTVDFEIDLTVQYIIRFIPRMAVRWRTHAKWNFFLEQ